MDQETGHQNIGHLSNLIQKQFKKKKKKTLTRRM